MKKKEDLDHSYQDIVALPEWVPEDGLRTWQKQNMKFRLAQPEGTQAKAGLIEECNQSRALVLRTRG